MLMRVMNTDRDGHGNNMFSSYDMILIWRARYRKVLEINCCIQSILYHGTESNTVPGNIS